MESRYTAAERPGAQAGHVEGGYAFVQGKQILAAWAAYKAGDLRFRDLRAWWGIHEMLARRCMLDTKERLPSYSREELARLTGTHAKSSVRALERCGLIHWHEQTLRFHRVTPGQEGALNELLDSVTNHNRLIPVPRRTIRMLAQVGKPAVMATVIGLLCRCVYYRDGQPVSWGRCKSSWTAETFGVTLRSVKSARKHLLGIGWLIEAPTSWRDRQVYGGAFAVNLSWSRPASYADTEPTTEVPASRLKQGDTPPGIAPRIAEIDAEFSPPLSDQDLPSESKNQKLISVDRSGFSRKRGREENTSIRPATWRHVEPHDLRDTGRLLEIFEQATAAGDIGRSEYDRLRFVAAAEHAIVHGTRNAPGLFVQIVRQKRWKYLTQNDEDAANQRLKRLLFGVRRDREPTPAEPKPKRIELTHEQKLARAIVITAENRKLPAMVLVRAMKLEWTSDQLQRYAADSIA